LEKRDCFLKVAEIRLKAVSGILLILLFMSMLVFAFNIQPAEAGTIVVPDDYLTIQEAINAAVPGDTVNVRAGTYGEYVVVNKSISLIGESSSTTQIYWNPFLHEPYGYSAPALTFLNVDDANLTGFSFYTFEPPSSSIEMENCSENVNDFRVKMERQL
jgi:hypothetical protein